MSHEPGHQRWLESFLERHGGLAGTVHVAAGDDLALTAACNIPPRLERIVAHVPHGKGMAGAAQVAGRSVQTCNLQAPNAADPVNPAAREAGGAAAVAIPVLDRNHVIAVVGITFAHEGEIASSDLLALERDADDLRGVGTELSDQ